MNEYYNDPCKAGQEGNVKEENTFDIEKSYTVEEVEEETLPGETGAATEPETYKVEIEHTFNDKDNVVKSYKTEFEIGKNDIITLEPAGAQLETYQNKYHYGFFANTDEDHINGYWYLGYTYLAELCNYKEEDWNTGNVYTLSYKDGQSKPGDPGITMKYNYCWQPLKIVATYLKPEEPKLELKEEYVPEYKEKIADPVKKNHLPYLNHLDLKEEDNDDPTPTTPVEETKEEVTPTVPADETPAETQPEVTPTSTSSGSEHHHSEPSRVTIPQPVVETTAPVAVEETNEETLIIMVEETTPASDEGTNGVDRPLEVKRNPQTGDSSSMNRNLFICLLSMLTFVGSCAKIVVNKIF